MAISNTSILIKRAGVGGTARPTSLLAGELAYSYASNTMFIGSPTGTGVINVGGVYYTQTVDAATNLNTAGTLVKRDGSGNFSAGTITAALAGNASTASKWQTARTISFTGDATGSGSVDGSADVATGLTLATTGVTAATYGGATQIPTFTVDAKGRLTAAANVAISSSFTVSGNTGSGTQSNGGTLSVVGGNGGGVTTTVSGTGGNESIAINVDGTVVRTSGAQAIAGDLSVTGNLIVTGSTTTVNTSTVQTTDSLLKLAMNNTVGDVVDIGFYGSSNTGSSVAYHGFVREGSGGSDAGKFYLFKNLASDPTGNVVNYAGLTKGTLVADLAGSTGLPISTGVSGLATGAATFLATPSSANFAALLTDEVGTAGSVVFSNAPTLVTPVLGVASGTSLNVSTGIVHAGVYTGPFVDGTVVDYATGQGRISVGTADGIGFYNGGVATTPLMNISSSGVITTATWQGVTVGVPYGGTGATSFTNGAIVVGSGTGALTTLANTTYTATGSGATNSTVTSMTVDAYGRLTAATYSAISGLTVSQGGTGLTTATTNGITYGNGTGAFGVTSAAGSADQTWSNQILTVTNAGVPVWSSAMDGGTF
jgi:hypothetical protein